MAEFMDNLGPIIIILMAVLAPLTIFLVKELNYKTKIKKKAWNIIDQKGLDYWTEIKFGDSTIYYEAVKDVIKATSLDFFSNGNILNIGGENKLSIVYDCPQGGMKDDDICEEFIKILNRIN